MPLGIHQTTELLVSPKLCLQLASLGITTASLYIYRRYDNSYDNDTVYHVICPVFDPLNILHSELPAALTEAGVHVCYKDLQAYSLMDMLKCIPGFYLTNVNNIFEVGADTMYKEVEPQQDERLPDAAAKLVCEIVRKRIFAAEYINLKISKPIKIS